MGSGNLHTIPIYTILLCFAIYPLIVIALPYAPPYTSNVVTHGHQKRVDRKCTGFTGDADTYGLGIRIGLYFQWITSSIAYSFVPSEAITMRGVNNCFQAAMFAGLLYITITKGLHGELHAVEAYLMLVFCMGGVCTGNSVDNVHDDDHLGGGGESGDARGIGSTVVETGYAYLDASTFGGYVRLLLACGFIAYGLWFVFVGMDGMFNAFPDDCNYAFFLARLDLSGRFREFLKALFILVAIPALVSLTKGAAILAGATWDFIFNHGRQGEANTQTPLPPIKIKTSSVSEHPGSQHIITRLLDAILSGTLLVFIIAVELTIRWNKIEGVQAIGSTGQLLPVIIGVGGVVRVLMRLVSAPKKKGLA